MKLRFGRKKVLDKFNPKFCSNPPKSTKPH
jgi:hypothetical protein